MKNAMSISQLQDRICQFCEERDWDQFHNPKDLAIGISTEASELLDLFRFKTEQDLQAMMTDEHARQRISEELSDVFYFLLRFAQKYDFDLIQALEKKMDTNELKYPVEKARGSNRKYNE